MTNAPNITDSEDIELVDSDLIDDELTGDELTGDELDGFDYPPANLEALQESLDLIEESGIADYDVTILDGKVEDWDVFFLVGENLDTTEAERIATVYTSRSEYPQHDASKIAQFYSIAGNLLPGLIVQLMDEIDQRDLANRKRQTATFLAGVVYRQTMEITDHNPKLKSAWIPLLQALNVQTDFLDDYLQEIIDDNNSNNHDNNSSGDSEGN